ncbi:MAG: glycoside hydrolase family 88 protein [Bryobacteraceae bacterium]|nr:glycoside hydrolase family 88 protein [Bryobacteraceae bacterium]
MRYLLCLLALSLNAAPRVVTIGPVKAPRGVEVLALPGTDAQFPPTGVAYRENAVAHQVWRGIAGFAPDVVLTAVPMPALAVALQGQVPVVTKLPKRIEPSPMSLERARRLRRTPAQLAAELAKVYGRELNDVAYIPAFAVWGRQRLGEDVSALVAPYLNGTKDSLAKHTASHFSGHLLFAALGHTERVRAAADLAITEQSLHNEMSDSVFMGCPLLASAGRAEAALAHLTFMEKLCLRKDGLYRHSPLNEAAWGRGNAFPALGLALMIPALPAPDRARPIAAFTALINALLPYQTRDGLWRQVIDHPTAYEEFSATAMLGVAIRIGIREGWLKGLRYTRAADRAWEAINARTASDGTLLDVCESTGKQKTLEDYLGRAAIYGIDPRGGAMALFLATERNSKSVQ